MALFDVPTGGAGVALQSGSPEYQNAIVSQTERNLLPAYRQALQGEQQDMASRGLDSSGVAAAGEAGLNQGYLNDIASTATGAATQGADVTLQNQRIQAEYAQQKDLQQAQLQAEQNMQQNQMNQQNSQMWSQLAAGAGQAAGNYFTGGGLGMFDSLAGQAAQGGGRNSGAGGAPVGEYGSSLGVDTSMPSFNY